MGKQRTGIRGKERHALRSIIRYIQNDTPVKKEVEPYLDKGMTCKCGFEYEDILCDTDSIITFPDFFNGHRINPFSSKDALKELINADKKVLNDLFGGNIHIDECRFVDGEKFSGVYGNKDV